MFWVRNKKNDFLVRNLIWRPYFAYKSTFKILTPLIMILLDREGLIKYVSNVQRFTLFKSPQWPNLMSISVVVYLGDNCIQNVYLGRYII